MLDTSGSPSSEEYIVYYIDTVNCPILPGFEELGKKPIKDIKSLTTIVDQVRELVIAEGFDVNVFDNNVSIYQLMSPDRIIKISWTLKYQSTSNPTGKEFADFYKREHAVEFVSANRVLAVNTDKGWKIRSINSAILPN